MWPLSGLAHVVVQRFVLNSDTISIMTVRRIARQAGKHAAKVSQHTQRGTTAGIP